MTASTAVCIALFVPVFCCCASATSTDSGYFNRKHDFKLHVLSQ